MPKLPPSSATACPRNGKRIPRPGFPGRDAKGSVSPAHSIASCRPCARWSKRLSNRNKFASTFVTAPGPVLEAAENGATYISGGLVPGSWAQARGFNMGGTTRIWNAADFTGLGNSLPTNLSGVQVKVNGQAAAVYFISPRQVNFQVP